MTLTVNRLDVKFGHIKHMNSSLCFTHLLVYDGIFHIYTIYLHDLFTRVW